MSLSYQKKILKSINNLPDSIQNNYKNSLVKHKFDLELYVPKHYIIKTNTRTNISTATVLKRNYLRDKLADFDSKMQEDKESLDQVKKEIKDFSKQYSLFNTNEDQSNVSSLSKTYDTAIEIYKARGYTEDKLFPKTNIFKSSLLLVNNSNLERIIENEESNQLEKEKKTLMKFTQDVAREIKGESFKYVSKKHLKPIPKLAEDQLPLIGKTKKAITNENKSLRDDIYSTEKSINDFFMSTINFKEYHVNRTTDNTIDTTDSLMANNNQKQERRPYNDLTHQKVTKSEINMGKRSIVKESKVTTTNNKRNNDNANINTSHNPKANANAQLLTKGNQRKKFSISKGFKQMVDMSLKKVELNNLYKSSMKANQQSNLLNIKAYISKYKKKTIEPVQYENGSNLHYILKDCVDKITMSNLPEIIHNFQVKTGDRGLSESKIIKIKALDSTLKNLEQESIKEILTNRSF